MPSGWEKSPDYGGPESPYYYLARIHRAQGDLDRALGALRRLDTISESHYDALLLQADILDELGRPAESADALDRAALIWPYELELHERLAGLHEALGNLPAAVRERLAVVALNPPDRAEAYYLLAVAQHAAGDPASARRSVMNALEIAPNYDEALELLLLVRASGS